MEIDIFDKDVTRTLLCHVAMVTVTLQSPSPAPNLITNLVHHSEKASDSQDNVHVFRCRSEFTSR